MTDLTETERKLLDIFGKAWQHYGLKALAIKDATGLTPTAAGVIVNRVIDSEEALAYAPLTTKRLLRIRSQRERSRQASRTAR
jgi:hypothetical protein